MFLIQGMLVKKQLSLVPLVKICTSRRNSASNSTASFGTATKSTRQKRAALSVSPERLRKEKATPSSAGSTPQQMNSSPTQTAKALARLCSTATATWKANSTSSLKLASLQTPTESTFPSATPKRAPLFWKPAPEMTAKSFTTASTP